MRLLVTMALFLALPHLGCDSPGPAQGEAPAAEPAPSEPPLRFAAAPRVVAFGDVHGDLGATRKVLRLAGAIDERDRWIGGHLVVVQTGDQLDRGDQERAILTLFERLEGEAARAGGAFHALLGNHELMNAAGDLRYVTPAGFADFAKVPGLRLGDPALAALPEAQRPRAAAFRPGGPWARRLARRNTVALVGATLFAHGGVLPRHVDYGLERINREVRAWLRGERREPPEPAAGRDGVTWTRALSDDPDEADCAAARLTLERLGAGRMVIGHTVQQGGVSPVCDGRVWRIDVGLSAHYGGSPAALEITDDQRLRAIIER